MITTLTTTNVTDIINQILPPFGTMGLDLPVFDSDKHMYLVDQYQFESGNRTLTYAAISDNIIVEVVFGHYHCWEYMNKLRVLTPDGTNIKVIATKEWEQSTRVDFNEIHSLVSVSIEEYVYNSPAAKGISKRTIKEEANKITNNLFSKTESYLDTPLGRQVLLAYCNNYKYCSDLFKFV